MEIITQGGKRKDLQAETQSGGGGELGIEDLQLTVTAPGQVQFNIFQTPDNDSHNLIINNALYFVNKSYTIGASGLNIVLTWLNEFPLAANDDIIFRKYKPQ